ncbi:hypothetical protein EBU24_05655 [bacterium]|nr:hypothetical protein [bacterium]
MFKVQLLAVATLFSSVSLCNQHPHPYEPWRRHQSVMHMTSATQGILVKFPPKDMLEQTLDVNGFNEFRRNTNFNTLFDGNQSPLTVHMIVEKSYKEYEAYLKTIMHPSAIDPTMTYMESKKENLYKILFLECPAGLRLLKLRQLNSND